MRVKNLRLAAALAAGVVATGCGGSDGTQPPPNARRVDASRAGRVSGHVRIEGAVPQNPQMDMSSDAVCARAHPGGAALDTFVVKDGGVDNVFVYVKEGLGDYYFDTPAAAARIDQQGCRYTPHVLGVQVNQPLEISNGDPTHHNVHAVAKANREFNFTQQIQGMKNTVRLPQPEVMVRVQCDIHKWMSAFVGVVPHPYFAVTSGGGRFALERLPSGTYTLEAWHEKLGTQTANVTIGEKESADVAFTFTAPASTN